MKVVDLQQAQTDLSLLLEQAAAGEEIVITVDGEPRARLVSLSTQTARRPPNFGFGDHYGWRLPKDFDDPDPEIEAMFYGDDES